ncbi:kelch repeat-containing protein [Haliangium sp.]|uniref:Kelch repeat-containing protein n=1 Tax=Haliangium sp. TaxID=2663208 RepID=UPI003D0D425B
MAYRFLPPPAIDASGACQDGLVEGPLVLAQAPATVRFTYRDAATKELVCDALVDPSGAPVVAVPTSAPVDLEVDFYGPDSDLVGAGRVRAIDLDDSLDVDVQVRPAERFTCTGQRATVARAFHSATALPSGQVLLVGGIRADPGQAVDIENQGLHLSSDVELYDPSTATFTPVSVPGLIPRALHQAVLIEPDADAEVTVALIGGLTVAGDAALLPGLALGTTGLRIEPGASAVAAPIELLTFDDATGTLTRRVVDDEAEARAFAAALPIPGAGPRVLVAGGWDGSSGLADTETPFTAVDELRLLDPATPAGATTLALATARMGATATILDDGRALMWGGHLGAAEADRGPLTGEFLDRLDSDAPRGLPAIYTGVTARPRAFHEAALAGDGSVLVAGGFDISAEGVAVTRSVIFAQRLVVDGTTVQVANVDVGGEPPPTAAYPALSTLPNGDVLITGGNPDPAAAGCATGAGGLVCSRDLAFVYRTDLRGLVALAPGLLRPRYGHRQTVLDDGTVLVTGGVSDAGGQLEVLVDAEIFVPVPVGEDDLGRAPGQVARDPAGQAIAPCEVIAGDSAG